MEGVSSIENNELFLIKKHGLLPGRKVAFEKVTIFSNSQVPVGSMISGILDQNIRVGLPIYLDNKSNIISNIRKIEEKNGDLYITTNTSEYKLTYYFNDIEEVETAKGSRYKYLDDGTTQRFKKVENKNHEPQSALVYIPDFDYIKKYFPKELLIKIAQSRGEYVQNLLEYVQGVDKKCYLINKEGKKLETNQEIIKEKDGVFLTFGDTEKVDFYLPVSLIPKIGFYTYDTRKYKDKKTGEYMRQSHMGNQVVKIFRKGEITH